MDPGTPRRGAGGVRRRHVAVRSSVQLAAMALSGAVAGAVAGLVLPPLLAALVGWDVAALVYLIWAWRALWPLDAEATAALAVREDPNRALRDALLLAAGLSSLLAVGALLASARTLTGEGDRLYVGLGIVSVLASWAVVHSVFAARYARLYYTGPDGGVDFNQDTAPGYVDFAYLAFTVGMTFQVSDTALTSTEMRATALRHALLSYLFGTVIIAATINLLAGLAR